MGSPGRQKEFAAWRNEFPILRNSDVAFLDSAASAQKPETVLQAMDELYRHGYANVHRGVYAWSQHATELYEGAREKLRQFIGAQSQREVVFTRGSTEALNLVAYSWGRTFLKAGDVIVLTIAEHHSNIVPWQILAQEKGCRIEWVLLGPDEDFSAELFRRALRTKPKLVSFTLLANALGIELPAREMVREAKAAGATVVIDAAQGAAHMRLDVSALGADFVALSGHKIYGPTGIGALYGREVVLESMPPFQGGGDMIRSVSMEGTTYNELPYKFEAGTPAIAEAVGFGAALDFVNNVGMDAIAEHEAALVRHAEERLYGMKGVRVLGPAGKHHGLLTFVVDHVHPHDLAQFLDHEKVAVRAGHHCAQPLMNYFGIQASTRASFGLYNTFDDVDRLATALEKALRYFA